MDNGVPVWATRHGHPATFWVCFLNTQTGILRTVFPLGEEDFNAHFFLDFIFFLLYFYHCSHSDQDHSWVLMSLSLFFAPGRCKQCKKQGVSQLYEYCWQRPKLGVVSPLLRQIYDLCHQNYTFRSWHHKCAIFIYSWLLKTIVWYIRHCIFRYKIEKQLSIFQNSSLNRVPLLSKSFSKRS